MQGMIDPPRPEASEAVKGCREAGIRVAMITADHAVTASAIGEMFGIARERSEVLTGRELETMSDDDLFVRVKDVSVYARVSPQHKLRIVQQVMKQGEVVAVTGDGVNDAPALQWVFRTEPLNGAEWVQIVMIALTVVVAVEVDKAIRRRKKEAAGSNHREQ